MYPSAKKEMSVMLRRQGKSLNEIVKKIGASKSIVNLWIKKIPLSSAQQERLRKSSKHAGRIAFTKAAQERHRDHEKLLRESQKKGREDAASLSQRDIFMLGLGLYWGEGYKKGSTELGFTNIDPKVITFYIKWLKQCFGIEKDRFILRVSINATHRQREKEVLQYWSRLLGVPLTQFSKTSFVKTKQKRVYANAKTHYGTLRIKARRGSVIRERILATLQTI